MDEPPQKKRRIDDQNSEGRNEIIPGEKVGLKPSNSARRQSTSKDVTISNSQAISASNGSKTAAEKLIKFFQDEGFEGYNYGESIAQLGYDVDFLSIVGLSEEESEKLGIKIGFRSHISKFLNKKKDEAKSKIFQFLDSLSQLRGHPPSEKQYHLNCLKSFLQFFNLEEHLDALWENGYDDFDFLLDHGIDEKILINNIGVVLPAQIKKFKWIFEQTNANPTDEALLDRLVERYKKPQFEPEIQDRIDDIGESFPFLNRENEKSMLVNFFKRYTHRWRVKMRQYPNSKLQYFETFAHFIAPTGSGKTQMIKKGLQDALETCQDMKDYKFKIITIDNCPFLEKCDIENFVWSEIFNSVFDCEVPNSELSKFKEGLHNQLRRYVISKGTFHGAQSATPMFIIHLDDCEKAIDWDYFENDKKKAVDNLENLESNSLLPCNTLPRRCVFRYDFHR